MQPNKKIIIDRNIRLDTSQNTAFAYCQKAFPKVTLTDEIVENDMIGVESGGIAGHQTSHSTPNSLQGEWELESRIRVAFEINIKQCPTTKSVRIVSRIPRCSLNLLEIDSEPIGIRDTDGQQYQRQTFT